MINWNTIKDYEDITFKQADGVARIAFNRPEVRNAFRPKTVDELLDALIICHESQEIGVVLLTGEGPSEKDGGWAFCSGGDQRVRVSTFYKPFFFFKNSTPVLGYFFIIIYYWCSKS